MKNNLEKRLFIGIPMGVELTLLLSNIQFYIQKKIPEIKWVKSENIHLTISFLGNVSKNDIQKLIKLLDKISFHGSFNIYVEKTGIFQSNKLQKIFWLGIGNGINKISALNQKIEKALSFNVKKKADNYSPHITIGRLKTSHGKIDVLPFLKYVYSPIEFNVNALYLYESLLHQNGAKYKVINKFPLN